MKSLNLSESFSTAYNFFNTTHCKLRNGFTTIDNGVLSIVWQINPSNKLKLDFCNKNMISYLLFQNESKSVGALNVEDFEAWFDNKCGNKELYMLVYD